jgi:hypothetical protein
MKLIIVFLFFMLCCISLSFIYSLQTNIPEWFVQSRLPFRCILLGGLGGVIYCLRGVYLNYSVTKKWDESWIPWYYIRPFVSLACGGISFLFLKAGLVLLESKQSTDSSDLGFYALAFVAGLNVDKFITKIEDIAQATWGIEKSRTAVKSSKEES